MFYPEDDRYLVERDNRVRHYRQQTSACTDGLQRNRIRDQGPESRVHAVVPSARMAASLGDACSPVPTRRVSSRGRSRIRRPSRSRQTTTLTRSTATTATPMASLTTAEYRAGTFAHADVHGVFMRGHIVGGEPLGIPQCGRARPPSRSRDEVGVTGDEDDSTDRPSEPRIAPSRPNRHSCRISTR